MRPHASLVIAGTMLAAFMLPLFAAPGHTPDWLELGTIGGLGGATVSLPVYVKLLTGSGPETAENSVRVTVFWRVIAFLVLFGFWFCVVIAANTSITRREPVARIEGTVTGKRISHGRYSNSYLAQLNTRRGLVESLMPRDVWEGLAAGQTFSLLECRGLFGYPYIVTPLDPAPHIDLPRLFGLRGNGELAC